MVSLVQWIVVSHVFLFLSHKNENAFLVTHWKAFLILSLRVSDKTKQEPDLIQFATLFLLETFARKKMECYGMYLGRYKHLALSFVIIIIIDMRNVQCLVV